MSFYKKSDGEKHRLVIMVTGDLNGRIDSLVAKAAIQDLAFDLADVLEEGIAKLERQLKKIVAATQEASNTDGAPPQSREMSYERDKPLGEAKVDGSLSTSAGFGSADHARLR